MNDLSGLQARVMALEVLLEEVITRLPMDQFQAVLDRAAPPLLRQPQATQAAAGALLTRLRQRLPAA